MEVVNNVMQCMASFSFSFHFEVCYVSCQYNTNIKERECNLAASLGWWSL